MKTLLTTVLLILMPLLLSSQVIVDGININEVDSVRVCQLVTTHFYSSKIVFDYGQPIKRIGGNRSTITNGQGKKVEFNSVTDASNYMINNGWEFVTAHSIQEGEGMNTAILYYYIFRRVRDKSD